jgi:hypothetical protein
MREVRGIGSMRSVPYWNERRSELEESIDHAERARRRGRGRSRSAARRRAKRDHIAMLAPSLVEELYRAWWLRQEPWALARLNHA